ncbi:tellurite resistance TerB family protein [Hyphomonas johnsonii]|uniref:Co-chaperone DjlA N-terminal domain-containing protein n=1 Tax=Hyphomonas johnsonii MHS-2 TaxID=1280950 RepID=A0A059FS39_9PROT|nr:tellurite resistance TerB family protein [Hyphomonas johnsonii]KCZ93336.1 hypothetical protein HJO_05755 [Hyphomonas johnsonii MHS-2]
MSDVQIIFTPTTTEKATTPLDLDEIARDFQSNTDWNIPEAYMCLILSAAFADGELAAEEKQEIAALVMRSRTMKRLDQSELAKVNATVNERLHSRPNGLAEACSSIPVDMRLSVFAHCVDIVLADGELRQSEADFLNRITSMLRLDADKAKQVLTVVMLKNRY